MTQTGRLGSYFVDPDTNIVFNQNQSDGPDAFDVWLKPGEGQDGFYLPPRCLEEITHHDQSARGAIDILENKQSDIRLMLIRNNIPENRLYQALLRLRIKYESERD